MKILMLTPYLPFPPSSGGQIRSYNLIKHLARDNEIHLVALIKSQEEEKYIRELKKYCKSVHLCRRSQKRWEIKNVLKSVFGKWPYVVVRNYSAEAAVTVKSLLKKHDFDVIHAETFYIMPLIPKTTVPILLVEQTVEYKVYQHFATNTRIPFLSKILWLEISKLKYWEKTYWGKANVVGAVSEDDKKEMLAVDPHLSIEIIPNAAGEDLVNLYDPKKITMKPNFLFTGNYTWIQNVEAAELLARKVFPKILESLPQAHCYIVGQHAQEKIGHLKGENMHIIDIAAADVKSMHGMFKKCSVFISTLEGPGGTRLKILGAMASGLPVISSATGLGGLNVIDGVHTFMAQTPEDFARIAKKLYDNPRLYQRIRAAARMLVEKEYDWTRIAAQLEKVYKTLVKKGRT